MDQRIVCAAIRNQDGNIITGARHYDMLMNQQIDISTGEWYDNIVTGFIDQRGNFLTRQQAFVVASAQGQIIRRCGGDEDTLYSENLY